MEKEEVQAAYRILGVDESASFREIMEAHRDLIAVWDPRRFEGNPRLERRAVRMQREVDEAFAVLREVRHSSESAGPGGKGTHDSRESRAPRASGPASPPRASLYDDAFADRKGKKTTWASWLLAIPVLIVIALLGALFLDGGGEPPPNISAPEAEEEGLSRVVEEVRSQRGKEEKSETQGEESTVRQEEADSSRETGSEGTPDPSPAVETTPARSPESRSSRPALTRQPSSPPSTGRAGGEETVSAENAPAEDEATQASPPETGPAKEAFELLQQESEIARKLVATGRFGNLRFSTWEPLRADLPKVLIDVVTTRLDDEKEVHLVWSINLDSRRIEPLSQAARDLVREERGPKPALAREP